MITTKNGKTTIKGRFPELIADFHSIARAIKNGTAEAVAGAGKGLPENYVKERLLEAVNDAFLSDKEFFKKALDIVSYAASKLSSDISGKPITFSAQEESER